MEANQLQILTDLFEAWSGEKALELSDLPRSGSDRVYYRMAGNKKKAIGVFNADLKENSAFLTFTRHFSSKGLPVPEIYAVSEDMQVYLQQDLGNTTLYDHLVGTRKTDEFPLELVDIYKSVIEQLPKFQVLGREGIDYSKCYPRDRFDKQSMMWDLNYFKYYFLKLAKITFDEQALENDFQRFADYLLQADTDFFMYRDFQSRNIMLHGPELYFIDYQGGRQGALQYDLASLLYDAKADIPQTVRNELLAYYMDVIGGYIKINRVQFAQYFYGYVLIRIMQAMGAYGFRGFYEKKEHFLKSIPFALENMRYLLKKEMIPVELPEMTRVLKGLVDSKALAKYGEKTDILQVAITSFSYRKGLPDDPTGNGGGFVFDCRGIHNPGRYDEYKNLTGKDEPVITFFQKESEMDKFLAGVFNLVGMTVEKYLQRNFMHLSVSFGCTGGQHRSVYCAEQLADYLQKNYKLKVVVAHREEANHPKKQMS